MKRSITISVIMCTILLDCYNGYCQIKTWQLSLTDSSKNMLYRGIENVIRFENVPTNSTFTSTACGHLNAKNGIVKLTYPWLTRGLYDTVFIRSKGKIIFRKSFVWKTIGDPKLRLGNITAKTASVEQILANPTLDVIIDSCWLKVKFSIANYRVEFIRTLGDPIEISSSGSDLPIECLKIIRKLKHNDKICFRDIRCFSSDDSARALEDLTVTII